MEQRTSQVYQGLYLLKCFLWSSLWIFGIRSPSSKVITMPFLISHQVHFFFKLNCIWETMIFFAIARPIFLRYCGFCGFFTITYFTILSRWQVFYDTFFALSKDIWNFPIKYFYDTIFFSRHMFFTIPIFTDYRNV